MSDIVNPEAAHEEWPREIERYIVSDIESRMNEMTEGRDGRGAHRSDVGIVFSNQILWGCRTREDLGTGIRAILRATPYWLLHYAQRVEEDRARAQEFLDTIPPEELKRLRENIRQTMLLQHDKKAERH